MLFYDLLRLLTHHIDMKIPAKFSIYLSELLGIYVHWSAIKVDYLPLAICTSPVIHLVRPLKLCVTFVFHFSWVLQPSQEKLKTIELERLSFTFVLDGKREFFTTWPSLPFTFYYFYSKISSFAPVLSIRIVLDSFYLLIFCCEK